MGLRVAAFTDTYLPTVNGVTYTVACWRAHWRERGGRMDVIYPRANGYVPDDDEHPVPSVGFPFYDGYRLGLPRIPSTLAEPEVVHAHTPFGLGLSARRLARSTDSPLIASYHTPSAEYADYLAPIGPIETSLRGTCHRYERWFLSQADLVITPSGPASEQVRGLGIDTPIEVVPNGVDLDRFRPIDPRAFLDAHGIDGGDRPLIGYTGRHGYEKRLDELLEAADGMDVTVVLGGDGPARTALERLAAERDVDAHFLGFLDRDELPAFYTALDVFAFPSRVETEGLVALEAIACGTPVVAADRGALAETVVDGVTGHHFDAGNSVDFRAAIDRTIDECDRLSGRCLERRERLDVARTIDRLEDVYGSVLDR